MNKKDLKDYIGKTFKGFKFESGKHDYLNYTADMDNYIGKELTITKVIHGVWFETDSGYNYPAELVIAQIEANENFEFGETVLVWGESGKQFERTFVFQKDKLFFCVANEKDFKNNTSFLVVPWKNAKKIPQKTKFTKQEFFEKFGIEFNNLEII